MAQRISPPNGSKKNKSPHLLLESKMDLTTVTASGAAAANWIATSCQLNQHRLDHLIVGLVPQTHRHWPPPSFFSHTSTSADPAPHASDARCYPVQVRVPRHPPPVSPQSGNQVLTGSDPTPRSPSSMAPRLSYPPSMAPISLSSPLRSSKSINQWRFQRPSSSLSILPPLTHLFIPDLPPYLSISHLAALSSTTSASVTHCKKGRGLIKVNGSPIELVKPEILRYKAFEPILRCTDLPMPATAPITPSSSLEVPSFASVELTVKEDRQIGSNPFPGASPHAIQRIQELEWSR